MRYLTVLVLGLAACSGGDKDDGTDEAPDLSDTYGTIDGELDYSDETIAFASGVAYGDSFFHDDNNVLVLTEWDSSQCGNGDYFGDWESDGDGYKLDLAFDDDGNIVGEESILWSCTAGNGCGGDPTHDYELSFDTLEFDVGGKVSGTLTMVDGSGLTGSLDFDVTYCGEG